VPPPPFSPLWHNILQLTYVLPSNETNFVSLVSVCYMFRSWPKRVAYILSWSSRFLMRVAASKTRPSNCSLVSIFLFVNLAFHSTPKTRIWLVTSVDSNNSISVTGVSLTSFEVLRLVMLRKQFFCNVTPYRQANIYWSSEGKVDM